MEDVFTIAELDTIIAEHKAAISAVLTSGRQYSLNTGHGQQSVSRSDLPTLRKSLATYADLRARKGGRSDFISLEVER